MKKLSIKVRSVAKFGLTLQNNVRRCFTDISHRGQSAGRAELNISTAATWIDIKLCRQSQSPEDETLMNTVKLTIVVRNLISSQLTMKLGTDIQHPQRMNSHNVGDPLSILLPPSASSPPDWPTIQCSADIHDPPRMQHEVDICGSELNIFTSIRWMVTE